MKTIDVKFQEHFKLIVIFKDMITFESELRKAGLKYYYEENEPFISDGIKYFLLDSNREEIDKIIKQNEIIAGTETINVTDHKVQAKIQKTYLIIAIMTIVFVLLITVFLSI